MLKEYAFTLNLSSRKPMHPWKALKADTHRQFGKYRLLNVLTGFFSRRTYRAIILMRTCQWLFHSKSHLRIFLPIFKILYKFSTNHCAMDLPWNTKIGGGFTITHGWGLVVNSGATIGNNVTLFHGVTLGRRDRIDVNHLRQTEYPTLEDEVWVGPNAIIIGGITIGRGSRIGGGAFVAENIPPYSVVAGNPGQIVRRDCPPDVMNPAPLEYFDSK